MLRLLALSEDADFVCYRYRLEAYRRALIERGWELDLLPWSVTMRGFLGQLPQIAQADAVVLQRSLLPWWKLRLIRAAAKVLIYELDDALFLRANTSKKSARSARRRRLFRRTVQAADACSVGNAYLRQTALADGGTPSQVHVVPTCVDHDRYPLAQHRRRGSEAQMVWVGSSSTLHSLNDALPGLQNAAGRLPGLELK